jgi:hypothetical protein
MAKKTPAETFAGIFNRFMSGSTEHERKEGERAMDAWLKRHGKKRIDIQSILAQAAADDAAQQPSPPPSDPRDAQPHPFEDPRFTPAGVVYGITEKHLAMEPHVRVIYTLYIVATHVYPQFRVIPRLALVSEQPDSGKSVALDVAKCLMLRSNPDVLSTGAAVIDFIDEGPGSIGLDEIDLLDQEARRYILLLWNLGHKRGATRALMVKGKRKRLKLSGPMMAAGLGSFLAAAQLSRTFVLEMQRYTEETKPKREFDDEHTEDLDAVYSYLRHWAPRVKLKPYPAMPPGVIARNADNARILLAVADACGTEWGKRAREAIVFLLEKAKAERPEIVMIRHGLAIFDMLEINAIKGTRFDQELKRLDLPDARWTRYRGPSGLDTMHPITPDERAKLLAMVGIVSKKINPPGGQAIPRLHPRAVPHLRCRAQNRTGDRRRTPIASPPRKPAIGRVEARMVTSLHTRRDCPP